ncbi:MAG: hypothetical protein IMZ53_06010 [Thermoplasmata archaeon]|nr:hypothetical protein [Thermoplasmata archaeon]MBE3140119.1 hypothetical protein [Thermoplasmata archaeon]
MKMVRCKNGRKHVVVHEYVKENETNVDSFERSCQNQGSAQQDNTYVCCVCGEEYGANQIIETEIKGATKNICIGGADVIHGLI